MKTLVSNLGFDADHIIRAVVEHDLKGADSLLLFRPEREDPRGARAIEELEGLTKKMYGNLEVRVEYVDPRDFEQGVTEIKRHIEDVSGELVLNLGGGDRALLVTLTVAAMFADREFDAASTFSDAFLERVPISVPSLTGGLDEGEEAILEAIRSGAETCTDLASELDLSPSTVSRRLDRLEDDGYVERDIDGNRRPVRLTFTGALCS